MLPFEKAEDDVVVPDCLGFKDDAVPSQTRSLAVVDPFLPAEMKSESARLQTFHTWPLTLARTLASHGFFLSQDGDCFRCAFCGLEVTSSSSAENVPLWHWQSAGEVCPLLRGTVDAEETRAKIVMARSLSTERTLMIETCSSRAERVPLLKSASSNPQTGGPGKSAIPSGTSHCGAVSSRESASRQHTSRSSSASESRVLRSGPEQQRPRGMTTDRNTSTSTTSSMSTSPAGASTWADIVRTASFPEMVPYQSRLHSLASWPLLHPAPKQLARAGFFREAPTSSSSPPSSSALSTSPSSSRPLRGSPPPASAGQRYGESPSSWRSPDASCGPCKDSVRCFWCGQRIHRWQRTDDPVLEHARLSPGCRYVMQLLGHEVHRDVIRASADEEYATDGNGRETSSTPTSHHHHHHQQQQLRHHLPYHQRL